MPAAAAAGQGDALSARLARALVEAVLVAHLVALPDAPLAVDEPGDVAEDVVAAVLRRDEAKALVRVPALQSADGHGSRESAANPAKQMSAAAVEGRRTCAPRPEQHGLSDAGPLDGAAHSAGP